jgi:3-hydroxyanthranilate 3,4-dioxygenase
MIPSLPFNLTDWIAKHRDQLKPPVGNKVLWRDQEFIVMAVGGPNQRTDYHYDEGAEFFYQVEGEMLLRIIEDDQPRDITIGEGEVFLLPPRVPHSPQRFANTIGIVIERQRREGEQDGLLWFCEKCHSKVYEEYFPLKDIEQDFPPVFERYFDSVENRTCPDCGHVQPEQ